MTDVYNNQVVTQVGSVQASNKHMICLTNEEFMFDPYLVRSIQAVPEDARSRHGELSRITFVDGGYQLLYQTDFDELVGHIAEVFNPAVEAGPYGD